MSKKKVKRVKKLRVPKSKAAEPIYLRKLVEAEGTAQRAAKLLGLSGTFVSHILAGHSACRAAYETAAKSIYQARWEEPETDNSAGNTYALVIFPAKHTETVERFIKALDGTITYP